MQISPTSSTSGLPASVPVGKPPSAAPTTNTFADLLGDQLQKINAQHIEADQAVQQFATGQTDNIHDVVLSVTKADLAFRMVLEIRNRLIESYQEVMRMQV